MKKMPRKTPVKLSGNQNLSYPQALGLLKKKEFHRAANLFRVIPEQNPKFSFARHYLGESYFALSQFEDAERAFRQAAELNAHFAPTLLFLGSLAGKKGDDAKKEEFFQKALQGDGKSAKELRQLAQTLIKIGDADHPAVFDSYRRAHQLNPQGFELYLEIAEISPPVPAFFAEFGEYLAESGKAEPAIFFLYLAAHSEPQNGENWIKLAGVLDKLGDSGSAEICRQRAEKNRQ